jgi:RNA polymerase-interacting CarD/CdnL/TRCF family regulator
MIAVTEQLAVVKSLAARTLRDQGKIKEARALYDQNAKELKTASKKYKSNRLKNFSKEQTQTAKNIFDLFRWKKARKISAAQLNSVSFNVT